LADKLNQIEGDVAAHDTTHACSGLNAVIAEVNAQSGKKISRIQQRDDGGARVGGGGSTARSGGLGGSAGHRCCERALLRDEWRPHATTPKGVIREELVRRLRLNFELRKGACR